MKNHIILVLALFIGLNSYSQKLFEKGYFIDNDNKKVNCFIKNIDWLNNPKEFDYKLEESSEEKTLTIKSVKEFEISNKFKYKRCIVNIDRSSEYVDEVSISKEPVFNHEELFLKVLVEGKANLYLYADASLYRYFYNLDNTDIEQLVYKSFRNSKDQIDKNNSFRAQLWNGLKCNKITLNSVRNVKYQKRSLVNFFIKYNQCQDSNFINFIKKKKKKLFNLTLRPGFRGSSLMIGNENYNWKKMELGSSSGYRLGIETELTLPFNNGKWSFLIEPIYHSIKFEETFVLNKATGVNTTASVDYKSIEIPIGIRRYYFLNNHSKVFVNGSFSFNFGLNSSVIFTQDDNPRSLSPLEINTSTGGVLGVGYKYKDKYSLELRYVRNKNLFNLNGAWNSEYNTFSFILGYSLFNNTP